MRDPTTDGLPCVVAPRRQAECVHTFLAGDDDLIPHRLTERFPNPDLRAMPICLKLTHSRGYTKVSKPTLEFGVGAHRHASQAPLPSFPIIHLAMLVQLTSLTNDKRDFSGCFILVSFRSRFTMVYVIATGFSTRLLPLRRGCTARTIRTQHQP
jgi:hypothetical protein